jgi:hypothetical protein
LTDITDHHDIPISGQPPSFDDRSNGLPLHVTGARYPGREKVDTFSDIEDLRTIVVGEPSTEGLDIHQAVSVFPQALEILSDVIHAIQPKTPGDTIPARDKPLVGSGTGKGSDLHLVKIAILRR